MEEPKYKFDLLFLKRFISLHSSFFPRLCSPSSWLFFLLLLVSGLEQFLAYETGLISGLFMKVLGDKDSLGFRSATIRSSLVILAMVVTKSVRIFVTKLLTIVWRRQLCRTVHSLYLSGTSYYRLLVLDTASPLDNPDQRITSDCSSITNQYGSMMVDLVVVPPTVGYYTYQAYSRAGWLGPTAMFVFFLVSSLVNKLLMSPVVDLTARQEQKEGNFRFKHMDIRKNCESLAFQGSADCELNKVNTLLEEVCRVQKQLCLRKLPIDLSVNLFSYLGAIVSYLVIAVPIFSGSYDELDASDLAQLISETGFVCMYLQFQLGQLVGITGIVASMAGSTHRVAELMERLKEFGSEDEENDSVTGGYHKVASEDESVPQVVVEGGSDSARKDHLLSHSLADSQTGNVLLSLEDVGISLPTHTNSSTTTTVVSHLTLEVVRGENLLVMGPSGSGKTSILRALRGLWPHSGRVSWSNVGEELSLVFLPQKPFFTNGSLREQVVYPRGEALGEEEDKQILDLLSLCDLQDLLIRVGGLDSTSDWYSVLSPGEQQRLAWARLLSHQPKLALLDEATSAVSEKVEDDLYSAAISQGTTLVSVGHRTRLRQFHSKVLTLAEGSRGEWDLNSCGQ